MATSFQVRPGTKLADFDTVVIAGIKCHVYGAGSIEPSRPVVLAMILHPRTLSQDYSRIIASEIIGIGNVVAVGFDLPNHGSRNIDDRANQDWAVGNPTHGQDLASCIELAASETECIARYIPSYYPALERSAASGDLYRVVVGASLGGHIAWRIAVGPHGPMGSGLFKGIVPIVGCPSVGEMLQSRVQDPDSLPLSTVQNLQDFELTRKLVDYPMFRILALCGGKDKYVPPSYTQEWASQNKNSRQKVVIDEEVGHFSSQFMIEQLVSWFEQLHKDYNRDVSMELPRDGGVQDAAVLSTERPYDEDN